MGEPTLAEEKRKGGRVKGKGKRGRGKEKGMGKGGKEGNREGDREGESRTAPSPRVNPKHSNAGMSH